MVCFYFFSFNFLKLCLFSIVFRSMVSWLESTPFTTNATKAKLKSSSKREESPTLTQSGPKDLMQRESWLRSLNLAGPMNRVIGHPSRTSFINFVKLLTRTSDSGNRHYSTEDLSSYCSSSAAPYPCRCCRTNITNLSIHSYDRHFFLDIEHIHRILHLSRWLPYWFVVQWIS